MIWFTSDQHFNHDRSFIYALRGFSSIEQANAEMVRCWNAVVSPDDEVFQLGDFFLGTDMDFVSYTLDQLNGKIHIIRGNHDSNAKINFYQNHPKIIDISDGQYFEYKHKLFYLCHYPVFTKNLERSREGQKICNIHGHTHSKLAHKGHPFQYNVAVDAHECYPVSIDSIWETIDTLDKKRDYAYSKQFKGSPHR